MRKRTDPLRTDRVLPQTDENIGLMLARPGRFIQPPSGKSRTQQQFRDESNPNLIIKRYFETGELSHVRNNPPQFIDCTAVDFESALNHAADIEEIWSNLPATVRRELKNPHELIKFLQDPKNRDRAIELGLIEKPTAKPAEPAGEPAAKPAEPAATKP